MTPCCYASNSPKYVDVRKYVFSYITHYCYITHTYYIEFNHSTYGGFPFNREKENIKINYFLLRISNLWTSTFVENVFNNKDWRQYLKEKKLFPQNTKKILSSFKHFTVYLIGW